MTLVSVWIAVFILLFFVSRIPAGDFDFTPNFLSMVLMIVGIVFTLGWLIRGCIG